MVKRNPKQIFTIFFTWNLTALWRRLKKLQWPWAPYVTPLNRDFPKDTVLNVRKYTEEYLRPTANINPYEPEIMALSGKLGITEKTNREYAEYAYLWAKNQIVFCLEVPPAGVLDTLKKGYGLCLNKMSVFAALMRLAGIPTRFLEYQLKMSGGFMQMMVSEMVGVGETGKKIIDDFEKVSPSLTHGCVEVFLDGEWIPADLIWTDAEEVGMEMPITQFGESPFGKFYNIVPDTIRRLEDVNVSPIRRQMWMQTLLMRGLFDRVNERWIQLRQLGEKRLTEVGREAYINKKKKLYVPPPKLIPDGS